MRKTQFLAAAFAVILGMLSLAGASAKSQPHWQLQKSGVTANLNDVNCASAADCIAAGDAGTVLFTTNGGASWKSVKTPFTGTTESFPSARCGSVGHCVVVAPPDQVMITANSGASWQLETVTTSAKLGPLGRVACPSSQECFVFARPGGRHGDVVDSLRRHVPLSYGGHTWHPVNIPAWVTCPGDCGQKNVGYALSWVSCVSATTCRAGGNTFIGSHEGYASAVLATSDSGKVWALVHSDFDPTYAACGTANVCVGTRWQPTTPNYGPDFERTTNGGRAWKTTSTIPTVLTADACNGPSFCESVGPKGTLVMSISDNRYKQVSPTKNDLFAVSCPKTSICYAVGAKGTILVRK